MDSVVEVWKDIEGYDGKYRISTLGRVLSYARRVPKILKGTDKSSHGYLQVVLSRSRKDINPVAIHRLVAEHFIPNPNKYRCVCHNDNNRFNNVVTNLRWDTHAGNNADKIKFGTAAVGDKHGRVKIPYKEVEIIRARVAAGETQVSIAKEYQVHQSTISTMVRWKHRKGA